MASVYDRWHLSRPRKGADPCPEHSSKTRFLVPSKDHGQGKRWQVRWRDAAGEQQKENFAKRSQADTRAATIEADLARGLYVDPAAGKESFRAVAERWRTSAVHRDGTATRVERAPAPAYLPDVRGTGRSSPSARPRCRHGSRTAHRPSPRPRCG
ncbi:hypothetical protein AB7952_11220 [Streptomyces sp. PG2]